MNAAAQAGQPAVISFNATIGACEKSGQSKVALELRDEMYQCRLESYKISCIAAISDMRSASCERRRRSYHQRRLESKMVSLNTTINICEESGQCKNALELPDEIQPHKLECGVISFNAAISLCEKGEL